jgi:predicted metal-dependent peptidase
MPPMVLIYDTSASTEPVRAVFEAEVIAIVEDTKPERVYVIYVDTEVARVDVFERGELIEFHVIGNGGTDFRPGFEWIDREGINPACAVYLTDGEGAFPDVEPDFPVLWAISTAIVAPFGQTVSIYE